MSEIKKSDIQKERERLESMVEKYPALQPLLDEPADEVQLRASTRRADRKKAVDERKEGYRDAVGKLTEQLLAGQIDRTEWLLQMREEIKGVYISSYVAGRDFKWNDVSQAEWGRVGNWLRTQYDYLAAWSASLPQDLSDVSAAKMNARAQLYANSASKALAWAEMVTIGVPADKLPAWPGDGTTLCKTNCKCRWSVRTISKARGDFDVSWRLGVAEHCRTCRKRAKEWKKIEIRGFQVVTPIVPVYA